MKKTKDQTVFNQTKKHSSRIKSKKTTTKGCIKRLWFYKTKIGIWMTPNKKIPMTF